MRFDRSVFLRALVCAAAALLSSRLDAAPQEGGRAPQKRALIVAIATYAPPPASDPDRPRWRTIHSNNDVPLIRKVLEHQEFLPSDIHEIKDAEATKDGILAAIRRDLIEPSGPGDVVVFHYSGHGVQIADDDDDEELDGYDETLVPYDAPLRPEPSSGYKGEKHLRDDGLNVAIQKLRRKVGPGGNVIAWIDSCFSGTPRGDDGSTALQPRGELPSEKPRPGRIDLREDEGGGFFEKPAGSRGSEENERELAPYVVFSAARHNQLAWETVGDEGKPVGSLSYALSRELASAKSEVNTYRKLSERVKLLMSKRVSNELQVEGNVDKALFSGRAVFQEPFLKIASVLGPDRVTVQPGTLAGLLRGTQFELHQKETEQRSLDTLLAKAEVVESEPLTAVLQLKTPVDVSVLPQSRAFVTSRSFGALRIRVRLEPQGIPEAALAGVRSSLEKISAVELVQCDPDVVVRQARETTPPEIPEPPGIIVARQPGDFPLLAGLDPSLPDLGDRIGNRLLDYAFSRYLRGLQINDEAFKVSLEMIPLTVESCLDPNRPSETACRVTRLDPQSKRSAGGQAEWRSRDWFKIRVHNESPSNAHITILELAPNGTIWQLWPKRGTQDQTTLASADTRELSPFYRFDAYTHRGVGMILLIATQEFVDFDPFLTLSQGSRGEPRGPVGPLAALFDHQKVRARAEVFHPTGAVRTAALSYVVVP